MSEELHRALGDPGYTPPRRAFPEVLALLAHPELGEKAERALLSAGLPAATYAAENLSSSGGGAPAIIRLVGRALRTHDSPVLLSALIQALSSSDPEQRRQAALALGKSGRPAAEPALLACLETTDLKLLRSVVEALGKVGGRASLEKLESMTPPPRLQPIFERAELMLARGQGRRENPSGGIVLDRELPRALRVVLGSRSGLEVFLAEEAGALGARVTGPGEVGLLYGGPLRTLSMLRLATSVALAWPLTAAAPSDVSAALLDPELVATLSAWSDGPLRFRLEWRGAGHRRADTWRIAQALRDARSALLNDPVAAPWVFHVESVPSPRLLLEPAGAPELRFAYRVRDVPAASHPTLAAALARIAGARADDVVWDPFAGSGVELIERALLGPLRELHGTDLDPRALAAARENAARAGVRSLELQQADARSHRVPGLSLVLTNPPMGRRVLRERGLSGVLCQVVRNVASQLAAGGRMVWLSPFAEATARAAADAGLRVERLGSVDLGGFSAELQRLTR